MSDAAIPLDLDPGQVPGEMVTLSPLVRRLVAPNPGPMTYKGTCTYVVGHGNVAVIDPGPAIEAHIDALLAMLGSERIERILVTHTHRDHSPGARLLQDRTAAPIFGCARYAPAREPHGPETGAVTASNDLDHVPDHVLTDGEIVRGSSYSLEAVATPGHTMNHLSFALAEENALFSGDHVMGWSTTIVSPPTGSMTAYMASLEKLRTRPEAIYWPGHGGPVRDPQRFVRALQHHRRQREVAILAVLRQGPGSSESVRAIVYEDLDPPLAGAATLSVLAHLEDLERRGRLARRGPPGPTAEFSLVV